MIHRRCFHVSPSWERCTGGPSKPPSPWMRPPRGPAWSRDSTTAAGRTHILYGSSRPGILRRPFHARPSEEQRTGEWAPPPTRGSIGMRAPPSMSGLHRRIGSSTGTRAHPPVSRLLHRHGLHRRVSSSTDAWAPPLDLPRVGRGEADLPIVSSVLQYEIL
jgi:hypothetical protein